MKLILDAPEASPDTQSVTNDIEQAIKTLLTTDGKGKENKTIALNLLLGLAFRQNVNLKNIWYK